MEQAIVYFTQYMDGNLLETELISRLSDMSQDVVDVLPEGNTKKAVLRLRRARDQEVLLLFGGITRKELDQQAVQGSPAAQAILKTG